ncbi:thiamine phosphate synthase [Chitinophaga sp. MM2321]|uniref:thiamine phosphate synthase n=1 Tax=Chitinophaga sp. MM2321 TaxID=3137178 RepID=UPI0032D57C33
MIWIITSPERLNEEGKILTALLKAGVSRILLRKPQWTPEAYHDLIAAIDPAFYSKIIIHDNFQVCHTYALGGIHLSGKMRNSITGSEWQLCLRQYPLRSTGIHHPSEIATMDKQFSALLLSPVFNSISKPGYGGRFAQALDNKAGHTILALGGVDHTNITHLKQWHFDGAALLGAIWKQPAKAVDNYYRIQELWNRNDLS